MKIFIRILIQSLLLTLSSHALSQSTPNTISVYGISQWPCAEHLEQRRVVNMQYEQAVQSFLTGYITAYNFANPKRQLVQDMYNAKVILAIVDRECNANPQQIVAGTLNRAVEEVINQR